MPYRPAEETLFACVWLPRFSIQVERMRHPDLEGAALALLTPGRQPSVVACSQEAQQAGLHVDMPLREALAAAPQAALLTDDPAYYAEVFARVATDLEIVSPLVEIREPGCAFA